MVLASGQSKHVRGSDIILGVACQCPGGNYISLAAGPTDTRKGGGGGCQRDLIMNYDTNVPVCKLVR